MLFSTFYKQRLINYGNQIHSNLRISRTNCIMKKKSFGKLNKKTFFYLYIILIFCLVPPASYAETFFYENWELGTPQTFLSDYYGNFADSSQWTIQSNVANGNYAAEHRFSNGGGGSYCTQHFGDSTKSPVYQNGSGNRYLDLYVQFKLYYSPGYDWSAGNNKQMIIGTDDGIRHDNICCNPWVSHYITLSAGGTGTQGYFDVEGNNKHNPSVGHNWFDLDPNINGFDQNNRYYIQTGRWYTVEIRRRLNDSGQSNGIFEMWIDGQKVAEYNNVLYRVPLDGAYGADFNYGTNFVMLSTYINNPAPKEQSMYYDDAILSSTYIGFGNDNTSPSPPANLRIIGYNQ